jgi:hypothetical protein
VPIIKPEIQRVLRASGLEREQAPEGTIGDRLNEAGLSVSDIAEELAGIAKGSSNEALRLRALESAMKAHGVLKDSATVHVPSFTVVIQQASDSTRSQVESNQILFPRQSINSIVQKEPVN